MVRKDNLIFISGGVINGLRKQNAVSTLQKERACQKAEIKTNILTSI